MPNDQEYLSFVADRGDTRLRLDQAVLRRLSEITPRSRTRVQTWIVDGRVTIDQRTATRASARLRPGMAVVVHLPHGVRRRQPPGPEPQNLDILFEDASLLVVNKPAGLVVHPSYKQVSGTLLNALLAHLPTGSPPPGIVTRLDKYTSGLVLVATAPDIHRLIQRDSHAGRVVKEYLALVDGVPATYSGAITWPLGRDPRDRRRMCVSPTGATAETRYEVLSSGNGRSVVLCELLTGRTHQIRAHLAALACPLVGDSVYGSRDALLGGRQALHAWRLTLPHPLTGDSLVFVAPPPPDFVAAAGQLLNGVR